MGGLVTRRKAIGDALARGLGIAGIALGTIGIAQAQPTNPSLNNAFVRKSPPIIQSIIPTSSFQVDAFGPTIHIQEDGSIVQIGDLPLTIDTTLNEGIRIRSLQNPITEFETLNWSGNIFYRDRDTVNTDVYIQTGYIDSSLPPPFNVESYVSLFILDNFTKKLIIGDLNNPVHLNDMDITIPNILTLQ